MATAIQQEIKTHSPKGLEIVTEGLLSEHFYRGQRRMNVIQCNYYGEGKIVFFPFSDFTLKSAVSTDTIAIFRVKPKTISSNQ